MIEVIQAWTQHPLAASVGLTLLHFVWQGAALWMIVATLLAALRRSSPRARYAVALGGLALMAACPFLTLNWLIAASHRPQVAIETPPIDVEQHKSATQAPPDAPRDQIPASIDAPPASHASTPTVAAVASEPRPPADIPREPEVPRDPSPEITSIPSAPPPFAWNELPKTALARLHSAAPWLAAAWSAGVFLLSLRLAAAFIGVRRMRNSASPTMSPELLAAFAESLRALGVRRAVGLVQSALVRAPAAAGWLRPIVYWPASALTGLTREQVRGLMAHELAHIRRHDYLFNALQHLVETLLFYHPAVWRVSSRARQEREHCCDDLAAAACGDRLSYARALERLEAARAESLALAANDGRLYTRIRRMVGPPEPARQAAGVWLVLGLAMSAAVVFAATIAQVAPARQPTEQAEAEPRDESAPIGSDDATLRESLTRGGHDWPMFGGTPHRNNAPLGHNIPTLWKFGIEQNTQRWRRELSENVLWTATLGTVAYGNPVVAGQKLLIGTNNSGRIDRFPDKVDLGCLLCFDTRDGKFLWQDSSEKLPTGMKHDFPHAGVASSPCVEGDRLWFVTNRCEVKCLDVEGFLDGENDGPFLGERHASAAESDVVWSLDMMGRLGVSPHNMSSSSVAIWGDLLFVQTSNGVDESHMNIPSPEAPSFLCLDKQTGEIVWSDNSPGKNIMHGQWSSPAVGMLGGAPQVIFGGGDGWLYSFAAARSANGKPELLWKFDCNPKGSVYRPSGRSDRGFIVAAPVIYDGFVYATIGNDPEYSADAGRICCIDPTKRGDVSRDLVFEADGKTPVPPLRWQAAVPEQGHIVKPNPNSGAVWEYAKYDLNGDGKIDKFAETMHSTLGSVTIADGLLIAADLDGVVHCLDAKSGKVHWTFDLQDECWGAPLIVENKIYIVCRFGISIFRLSRDPAEAYKKKTKSSFSPEDGYEPISKIENDLQCHTTPIVAGNVLYLAAYGRLFAISNAAPPSITGEVVDEEYRPVAGIEVQAYDDRGMLVETFKTDENGQFRAPASWWGTARPPEERRHLFAVDGDERLGWCDLRQFAEVHEQLSPGAGAPDKFRIILFRLDAMAWGRFVDSAGSPQAGVKLALEHFRSDENFWLSWREGFPFGVVTSGADGRFHFRFPRRASVDLAASHAGDLGARLRISGPLMDGRNFGDVVLWPAGQLEGAVSERDSGRPIAGAYVVAIGRESLSSDGPTVGDALTDGDGRFRISGLPAGEYVVHTQAFLPQARLREMAPPIPDPVRIEAGKAAAVKLQFENGVRVTGRVVQPDGITPVAGVQVSSRVARHPGETELIASGSTSTNQNGEFELYVPTGICTLAADGATVQRDDLSSRAIAVSAGKEPPSVVLVLAEQAMKDQWPPGGAPGGQGVGSGLFDTAAQSDPKYVVNVTLTAPALHKLGAVRVVALSGHVPLAIGIAPANRFHQQVMFNEAHNGQTAVIEVDAPGFALARSAPFVIEPETREIKLELAPAQYATAQGRVRDKQGRAVEGARVRVGRILADGTRGAPQGVETTTDAAGDFSLPYIRVGEQYFIKVDGPADATGESTPFEPTEAGDIDAGGIEIAGSE